MSDCKFCNQPIKNAIKNQIYHGECLKEKKRIAAREQYLLKNPTGHKVMAEKKCELEICGNTFRPHRGGTKYCSRTCYRIANARQVADRPERQQQNEDDPRWAVPSAPTVPKFTKMVHRIFFEMRSYA